MNRLTTTEKKVLNNVTRLLDPTIMLGDVAEKVIDVLPAEGTPVNAVSATETLTLSGVVIHGETLVVFNPELQENPDVYEFLATGSQYPTAPTNIPVDITAATTQSSGELTMDTQPISGNTVTIGSKTYTFVPVGTDTADGEVSIGLDLAGAQAALVNAINGLDDINVAHALVTAGDFVADEMILTAVAGGTAGDSIATTETFTAVTNVFGAEHLTGGADCSAADAITALVAAITASDTQGVGAVDSAGDTVVLTADLPGEEGDTIIIESTMRNGALPEGASTLSGGVNGTVSTDIKMAVDDTYLYVCIAPNSVNGQNWRRIAIGNVY